MREEVASADRSVARIAASQHGVVAAFQLARIGVDKDAALRRSCAGRLHRIHRGVYAVGHAGLSREGRWMAAVLACGEDAVLSHCSAAALWGLLPPADGPVSVTVPGLGGRPRRRGIDVHRSRTLAPTMVTRRLNIPVTRPPRTLADLRRQVDSPTLRKARRQAAVLGLVIEGEPDDRTRSELEHSFLRLIQRHRLPTPQVNPRIGPHTVDFLWPEERLIVETDGYRYHRGRGAFEDDRARDLHLRLQGYEVLRFSYRQVVDESRAVAAAIRLRLERSGR